MRALAHRLGTPAGDGSAPARRAALVTVAGAVTVSVLAVTFASILDDVLDAKGIASGDLPVARWIAAHRDPGLTTAMRVLTQLGNPLVLILTMTSVCAVIAALNRSMAPLGIGALALGGFILMVIVVKLVVGRPRPSVPYRAVGVDSYSFPSGHATGVSVVGILSAWMLTRWCFRSWIRRTIVWTTIFIVIASVGFSRIYLTVHYLSDVIAGWALGALWAGVLIIAARLRQQPFSGPNQPSRE